MARRRALPIASGKRPSSREIAAPNKIVNKIEAREKVFINESFDLHVVDGRFLFEILSALLYHRGCSPCICRFTRE